MNNKFDNVKIGDTLVNILSDCMIKGYVYKKVIVTGITKTRIRVKYSNDKECSYLKRTGDIVGSYMGRVDKIDLWSDVYQEKWESSCLTIKSINLKVKIINLISSLGVDTQDLAKQTEGCINLEEIYSTISKKIEGK